MIEHWSILQKPSLFSGVHVHFQSALSLCFCPLGLFSPSDPRSVTCASCLMSYASWRSHGVLLTFIHLHIVMESLDSSHAWFTVVESLYMHRSAIFLDTRIPCSGTIVCCVDKSVRILEVLIDFRVSCVQLLDLTCSASAWWSICFIPVTSLFSFCHVSHMGLLRLYGCTCL